MNEIKWYPSQERVNNSNMTRFMQSINQKLGTDLGHYDQLYKWSVDHIPEFWAALWEFTGIVASQPYDRVVENLDKMPGAHWFPGAQMNFAENLLRYRDDRTALLFKAETAKSYRISYAELYNRVAAASVNRAANWGGMFSLEEAEVEEYTFRAVMDERTSPICRSLNGRFFSVTRVMRVVRKALASPPSAIADLSPWPSYDAEKEDFYIGKGDDRDYLSGKSSSWLADRSLTSSR